MIIVNFIKASMRQKEGWSFLYFPYNVWKGTFKGENLHDMQGPKQWGSQASFYKTHYCSCLLWIADTVKVAKF